MRQCANRNVVGSRRGQLRHSCERHPARHLGSRLAAAFRDRFKGELSEASIGGERRLLLKPQTFMNASGRAVQMLAGFFKIPPEEILVVHDELDFAPGTARLKQGGGIAGHNGLKDISQRLGTHEYWRLRIGVGRPTGDSGADYVLEKPPAGEREAIEGAIARALEHVPLLHFECCYYQGIEFAIARGLARFEGGAQGEHKIFRGLLPVETLSAHWLAHPQFARAVESFLAREGAGIARYVDELCEHSPFKETS